MEQSTKDNNRKDFCGDVKERDEEPTTSKADFNDPSHVAHNTNDSKTLTLDFNSADDVRLAMKALTDEIPHDDETANKFTGDGHVDDEVTRNNDHIDNTTTEKVSENINNKVKTNTSKGVNRTKPVVTKQRESRRAKKRKARTSKQRPAKRYKGTSVQGFYWGKLSNLIFLRNSYRSDSSSEDSFFSL